MAQCSLTVLVQAGSAPIRCRRSVWVGDLPGGVCYSCHPRGREDFIEAIVREVLKRYTSANLANKDDRRRLRIIPPGPPA